MLTIFFLFLSACHPASIAASSPTEVIELTDASFEHDTQASTGQTTGIWAVLLSTPSSGQRHQEAMQLWTKLAENEDKGEIFATVNLDENKAVAARFIHHLPSVPSLLLLRGRGMYVYSIPEDDAEDHIIGIITGGYQQLSKLTVPPEVHPSQIDEVLKGSKAKEADIFWTPEQIQRAYIAGASLAIGLIWKVAIFFHKRGELSSEVDESPEQQVTAENQAVAAKATNEGQKKSSTATEKKEKDGKKGSKKSK